MLVNKQLVRRLRHRRNLTQRELGQAIGQDQPYVSNVERGVRPMLTVAMLEKLAVALGVTMEELLTDAARRRRATASREGDTNAPEGQPGA